MKRILAGLLIGASALAFGAPASAGDRGYEGRGWERGHYDRDHGRHHRGHGYGPRYGYYEAPPVIVVPPPRVVYAPPPVYVAPRPIYIAPAPVYVAPPTVGFGFRISRNVTGYVTAPLAPGYVYAPPGRVVYGW